MNRNWRLDTTTGPWAVKQVHDVNADAVRRQFTATTALAARRCPVPAPKPAPDGDALVEHDGRVYTAVTWAPGTHHEGISLTLRQVAALGALLADIHTALSEVMPEEPARIWEPVPAVRQAIDRVDQYAAVASGRHPADSMDLFVVDRMRHRRRLLADVAHLRPADDIDLGRIGWTHGDFQHLNLLYHHGELSAVVDWDRLKPRPLTAEVVRAATLLFGYGDARGLDLQRVTAFVGGYQSTLPTPPGKLAAAVHRLWWKRMCDTWHLDRRYGLGNCSCDHLFRSAEALLDWWTVHRDTVTDAFTGRC